ncbi:MAG: hypothetical protein ABSH51_13960 [Solirubrobacteraceae bacterium]|jgi:hypothetical protein
MRSSASPPPTAVTRGVTACTRFQIRAAPRDGDRGSASRYEYDHLVSLELGGATNDPRNLWPEPGASPNPKDEVEDYLNAEVCDGKTTLSRAQLLIATNWVALYREITQL